MLNVPVVMLVAAIAVLVGVVYVATGRGGELAFFQADYSPLKLDQVTSADVALFRPPTVLWGYSTQATDEALSRIAGAITERDVEISALQQRVADLEKAATLRRDYAAPQTSSGGSERPSRRRREPRPPEPDAPGSAPGGQETPLPAKPAKPAEPAGQSGREPGETGAPPTVPWLRQAPGRGAPSAEWAALPKRPPGRDDGEAGQ